MPRGRGRRRTLSQGPNSRNTSRSSRGRSASSTDSRLSRSAQRRSARILSLATTREETNSAQESSLYCRSESPAQRQYHSSDNGAVSTAVQVQRQDYRHQWTPGIDTTGPYAESEESTEIVNAGPVLPLRNLTPPLNGGDSGDGKMFDMSIVLEPAARVRPANVLRPPMVIKLKHRNGVLNAGNRGPDYAHMWALASIVSEEGTTALAPPRTDLLLGTPVNSIHKAARSGNDEEVGYVCFTDLAIQQPGKYRIRVSLIRMEGLGGSTASSVQGGANLQSVVSRIIHVDAAATVSPCSK
ncbi:MAG: hypothetical protein LQ347_002834 [Umbilicaria vellea]|nr:MAG: hypothetical protein LQ347_002834 [Umbilicaria vellea]